MIKEVIRWLPEVLMGNSARAGFGFTLDDEVISKTQAMLVGGY
jgi:hypothetical protein